MAPVFTPKSPRPHGARKRSLSDRMLDTERPPVTHGYVKSFDGTRLFYSVEGQGLPLVFCYGLVCSSLHWTYQIDYFQKNYKAVWFDYRGHQNSETPKNWESLTIENIARDLGTVLDELGLKEAVILGHSMGVNIVLEFYRMFPHRVKGMILANGTAQRPLETLLKSNATQAGFAFLTKLYQRHPELVRVFWKAQRNNPLWRSIVALGGFNPHLTPKEDIDMYVDQVIDMDPGILIRLINDYERSDSSAWLHTVKAPTLILAGDQDKVVPVEQQELLRQLIPNSRYEVIRHGSHCPQMDLPDLVNLRIERFLNEIGYRAPAAGLSAAKAPNPPKESANPPSA